MTKVFPAYQVNAGNLNLSVIWNLDFWGKYRRQTEAARAHLLATEWGQRAVISSLVANLATAYFQLRALDSELEISKRTLASRQESLKLTQFLETDPDKAATIARCQATRLGWLVAVPACGILEEHSPQAVCTSGPSCSRLLEPARLGFLRVQCSS